MKKQSFLDKRISGDTVAKHKQNDAEHEAESATLNEDLEQDANEPSVFNNKKEHNVNRKLKEKGYKLSSKLKDIKIDDVDNNSEKNMTLVEEIPFHNGNNTLSIKLFKKPNRLFCVKVFLNETYEIRPVTYTGVSTGNAFFQLLKAAIR